MKTGIVLLAHGARDPAWAGPFEAVAARLAAAAPQAQVRLAFLELMAPGLAEAAGALADDGCVRIDVVPVFLGMGGHLRRDVPCEVDALRARHPAIDWHLHPALGESPQVIEALARAAHDLCAPSTPDPLTR